MKLTLVAGLVGAAVLAGAQLNVRNHRAYSMPFLRMGFPDLKIQRGERVWTYELTIANDYREEPRNFSPVVVEDWEMQRVQLGLHEHDWFIEGGVAARNGGALDAVIDWWHRLAFSYQTLRDYSPHGQTRITSPGQRSFGTAFGLTDVTVGARRGPATVAIKLPLGNPRQLLGSGNIDVGASVARSWQQGRWGIHALAGLVWQGRPKELRAAKTWIPQQQLGVSYNISSSKRLSIQWQSEPAAVKVGAAGADSMHNSLVFGLRQTFKNKQVLDLYLVEDGDFLFYGRTPSLANVGADFTIGARLSVRF
ncbi:MAG: DUF3187 family protein [Chthonomonas sp.]|nr:DUF3187 family protein [Chthonomonas sp.]